MTVPAQLLSWYRRHGRALPWRQTRDPYRILVSEIMLQQTQVQRVLLYYTVWLKRFPSWRALARASNADVIRVWSGLGYNRRALVLRNIARLVEKNGVPKNTEDWLALKGIGPYTAAALAAFSLHDRVLPIDTNIRRVAGRLLLGRLFPLPSDDARIRDHASLLLPARGKYFDIPQALFDLAATHCTKNPSCADCPLHNACPAAAAFLTTRIHIPKKTVQRTRELKHAGKPFPDRIYRGRILQLLGSHAHGIPVSRLGPLMDNAFRKDKDTSWLLRMLDRMTKDELIKKEGLKYLLA